MRPERFSTPKTYRHTCCGIETTEAFEVNHEHHDPFDIRESGPKPHGCPKEFCVGWVALYERLIHDGRRANFGLDLLDGDGTKHVSPLSSVECTCASLWG